MFVNLLYEARYPQYNLTLDPVAAELVKQQIPVSISDDRYKPDLRCDTSLNMLSAPLTQGSRPRFFMEHGCSITKRHSYDIDVDCFLAFSENWATWLQDEIDETYHHRFKIYVTGSPKADAIHWIKTHPELLHHIKRTAGIDENRPLVIYAPTYKSSKGFREHNARTVTVREVIRELMDDYQVMVFRHQMDTSGDADTNFGLSYEDPHPAPNDAQGRLNLLSVADCVITDTSAIYYEACALDVPVVAIDNTLQPSYLSIKILGVDDCPARLNAGPIAENIENLPYAVTNAIASKKNFAEKRSILAEHALGAIDGMSARRVVETMKTFNDEWEKKHGEHGNTRVYGACTCNSCLLKNRRAP